MTRRAPELSATSRLVCIWIMMHLFLFPYETHVALQFPKTAVKESRTVLFPLVPTKKNPEP
jgi:hypothetical protein